MEALAAARPRGRRWTNVLERPSVLASVLISPAVVFILALVGGPLALAVYLSFTNAIGGSLHGKWIGLGNFRHEWTNPAFKDAVWHTFLFTVISQAVVLVVAGLLAHALLKKFPGKWFLRFLILLPWAAPLPLSLMGWTWIFDTTYSIINWTLQHLHLASTVSPPQWLAQPRLAMGSVIAVHAWRIIPFATGLRKFWSVSLPLQIPIATVALLFGIVFTATDMAVVYILTNGGPPPSNATEMVTTWAYKTGIESGSLGAGAAISLFLLPVLAVVAIGMLIFARRAEVT